MSKIAVMAFSGGMDSTGLLVHLLANDYEVHTLSYDYGQKHKLELDSSEMKVDVYEILEKSSVYIDDEIDSNELKLKIDSKQDPNIYIYGHEVFDDTEYEFSKGTEKLDIYVVRN